MEDIWGVMATLPDCSGAFTDSSVWLRVDSICLIFTRISMKIKKVVSVWKEIKLTLEPCNIESAYPPSWFEDLYQRKVRVALLFS